MRKVAAVKAVRQGVSSKSLRVRGDFNSSMCKVCELKGSHMRSIQKTLGSHDLRTLRRSLNWELMLKDVRSYDLRTLWRSFY